MKHCVAIGTLLLAMAFPVASATGPEAGLPGFPTELQGVWDAYPLPCDASEISDSDMRMVIESETLRGYENNDALRSIERIADEPSTWRVVTISDIAPPEIQGEADIYVLRGHVLTITNGERAYTHIRCR